MKLYLEHNPFTVETILLIDGKKPDEKAFSDIKSQRFQQWIETFFPKLNKHFNGLKNISVEFKGVENDYLDLLSAVEEARKDGMEITVNPILAENANERLGKIQQLVNEAKKHPLFKDKIEKQPEIIDNLNISFSNDFDVYVAATMSSGKSTLINAMLGYDLSNPVP